MGNEEHLLEYRGEHHPEARAAPSVVPGGGGLCGSPSSLAPEPLHRRPERGLRPLPFLLLTVSRHSYPAPPPFRSSVWVGGGGHWVGALTGQ